MWLPFVWEAILNLRTLKWFPQVKCPPDPHGVSRPPGSKEDTAAKGGIVYVRWDHESCPDGGAQLVYAGRAGGSYYDHRGGGSNPQWLPLDQISIKQSVEHRVGLSCMEQNMNRLIL